jgi:hypothetical protein
VDSSCCTMVKGYVMLHFPSRSFLMSFNTPFALGLSLFTQFLASLKGLGHETDSQKFDKIGRQIQSQKKDVKGF